jgi:hypothetical protein
MLATRAQGSEDATSVLRLELLAGDGSEVTRTDQTIGQYRHNDGIKIGIRRFF